ncbi:hypothetical protein CJ673_03830 [Aliarcobacter cryaerophilus]|uniref:Uncharacterized protein n=1 Tax=Aliarcobacter cryaerophilus TaxID=28198 RepID=A0A2S9TB14_9BACT|nr:hypothetical protein [Aliarcobacter cryaerophilus]PRM96018.1 hypothetical protein CJ673_03830 [Aliarcobacter cryaerophilus]
MQENFTVTLNCMFCDFPLQKKENHEVKSGDLIKCDNCNQDNDYNSLLDIAKEQGMELVKNEVRNELKNIFKKSGK